MKRVQIMLGVAMLPILTCCGSQPAEQSVMVTAANETAAMARLRAIAAAEARYQVESGGEFATLDQLIEKRYVNDPSRGKLTGYRFEVRVSPGAFQATAVPEKFPVTGTRSFYIDQSNVMRAADKKGAPASASDPEA
jgi:Tfp pilus assembly protein PilE